MGIHLCATLLMVGATTIVLGDLIHVNLAFWCTNGGAAIGRTWCGEVKIAEHDPFSWDTVVRWEKFCETGKVHVFNFTLYTKEDEKFYGITYHLKHECAWGAFKQCLQSDHPKKPVEIGSGELLVSFEEELYGGLSGNCPSLH